MNKMKGPYSSASIQLICNSSTLEDEDKVILSKITYGYAPSGIQLNMLMLKIVLSVMIIRNLLYPYLRNGKIFDVKHISRELFCESTIPEYVQRAGIHALHSIVFKLRFSYVSASRSPLPLRSAFSATMHKAQRQTLKNVCKCRI